MQILLSKIAFGNFHAHSIHTETVLFLSSCINRKLFTHESGIPQNPINMVYLRLKTIVMILHNYRKSGALFAWVATKNTNIINFLLFTFLFFFICITLTRSLEPRHDRASASEHSDRLCFHGNRSPLVIMAASQGQIFSA